MHWKLTKKYCKNKISKLIDSVLFSTEFDYSRHGLSFIENLNNKFGANCITEPLWHFLVDVFYNKKMLAHYSDFSFFFRK